MAKKVDALPMPMQGKYPWSEWLDGDVWELEPEADFLISVENFRTAVYAAAKERGLKATVRTSRNGMLYLQASRDVTADDAEPNRVTA